MTIVCTMKLGLSVCCSSACISCS